MIPTIHTHPDLQRVLVRFSGGFQMMAILNRTHDAPPNEEALVVTRSPDPTQPGYVVIHTATGLRVFERPYDFLSQARACRDALLTGADWGSYGTVASMRSDTSLSAMAKQINVDVRRGLIR